MITNFTKVEKKTGKTYVVQKHQYILLTGREIDIERIKEEHQYCKNTYDDLINNIYSSLKIRFKPIKRKYSDKEFAKEYKQYRINAIKTACLGAVVDTNNQKRSYDCKNCPLVSKGDSKHHIAKILLDLKKGGENKSK